jgi:hypothetical protein
MGMRWRSRLDVWGHVQTGRDSRLIVVAQNVIEATALSTNAQEQIELIGVGAIASNPLGATCFKP